MRKTLVLYGYKGYEKLSNGEGGCRMGKQRLPSLVARFYIELVYI